MTVGMLSDDKNIFADGSCIISYMQSPVSKRWCKERPDSKRWCKERPDLREKLFM